MKRRLPLVDRESLDALTRTLYDEIEDTRDGMPTSFQTFLNSPSTTAALAKYGEQLRWNLALTDRQVELVILRVAADKKNQYQWVHHVEIAKSAGISTEEMNEIEAGGTLDDDIDSQVLSFVDAMVAESVTDDQFEELLGHLGEKAMVDLVFLVAYYVMLHVVFRALDITSESDTRIHQGEVRDA